MACQLGLQDVIKEEFLEDEKLLPKRENYSCDLVTTYSFEDFSFDDIKNINVDIGCIAPSKLEPGAAVSPHNGSDSPLQGILLNSQFNSAATLPQPSPPEFSSVKHWLKGRVRIYPPIKIVGGRCNTHEVNSLLSFLESFSIIACSSRFTHSFNCSVALNIPRVLICEECSVQCTGLYERFLKLCRHYKTCHRRKCNLLIGQKWMKYQAPLKSMMSALQMDIKNIMLSN